MQYRGAELLHGLLQVEVEACVEQYYDEGEGCEVGGDDFYGRGSYYLVIEICSKYGAQEEAYENQDQDIGYLCALEHEGAEKPK